MDHWTITSGSPRIEQLLNAGWSVITASPLSPFERRAIGNYLQTVVQEECYPFANSFFVSIQDMPLWVKNVGFKTTDLARSYEAFLDIIPSRIHQFTMKDPPPKHIRQNLIGLNWMLVPRREEFIFSIEDHSIAATVKLFAS